MKGNSLLAMMVAAVLFTSCGKEVAEIFGAPTTKEQAGLIASCTTRTQAQTVAQELGAKFRVINEEKGLVEFINIDEAQLRERLPRARFKQNVIYKDLVQGGNFGAQSIGNVQFTGAHNPTYRTSSTSRYFPHLDQIEGTNFVNNVQGEGVTIAVIDTGVYYNHPHLSPNVQTNNNDRHGDYANGSDEDGNGYADDYVGWDFYNHDAYPIDDHGHGTHVAGLAAGTLGGIAPKAKILPVKVLGSDGSGDLGTIAAGILYAIQNGADVINLSLGGPGAGRITSELQQLINMVAVARDNNIMIVAAAGNGGEDSIGDCNDENPVYPANIDSTNLLSVAAVDAYNQLASYSNFGGHTVHVSAPGGDSYTGGLVSTGIANCGENCGPGDATYYPSSGTSMATPVVAGLVALIKSASNNIGHGQIKEMIMQHGITVPSLDGKIKSGQVVNIRNTLEALF
jgi:subtilisin family serine protease